MTRVHHIAALSSLVLGAACAPHVVSPGSPAPTAPPLSQWIRIHSCPRHDCSTPHSTYEGYLVGLEDDVLVLHASGPEGRGYNLEVPRGWLSKIELYRGNRRTGAGVAQGAAKGAGMGAIGGALLGLAGSLFSEAFDFFDSHDTDLAGNMARGAAAGAATGAVAGAVDGALKGEMQWEEVTLERVRAILCLQRERYCADSAGSSPPRTPPASEGDRAGN